MRNEVQQHSGVYPPGTHMLIRLAMEGPYPWSVAEDIRQIVDWASWPTPIVRLRCRLVCGPPSGYPHDLLCEGIEDSDIYDTFPTAAPCCWEGGSVCTPCLFNYHNLEPALSLRWFHSHPALRPPYRGLGAARPQTAGYRHS